MASSASFSLRYCGKVMVACPDDWIELETKKCFKACNTKSFCAFTINEYYLRPWIRSWLKNIRVSLWQRCTGGFQDSNPAGFSTFSTKRIGSGLRFYSRIFKFHFFGIWRQHNHKKNFCKDLKNVMQFTSIANVGKRHCYTGRVVHCRAPVHHHSIPSVHYQAQYNVMLNYICILWVVEARDVVLLCLFCCIIYFSVHRYHLVLVYRLGLNHQLLLVDVASLASLSCFVIKSLIGNIAFSFMFHCMNLVDCIFWIWLWVPFLVFCGYIFPSLCSVELCFSERKWL